MAKSYYSLLDQGDFEYVYSLRSSRSKSQTSFADFQKAWTNNIQVRLEGTILSAADRTAVIQGQLNSTDDGPDGRQNAVYDCRICLVREGGEWRYDGGDFQIQGQETMQVKEDTSEPSLLQADPDSALAVIAPSISTSRLAREVLRTGGIRECSPKEASGVLVVVRSELADPLSSAYKSYRELADDAEGQLNISGSNYHLYLFEIHSDLSISQLNHKSFEAEE